MSTLETANADWTAGEGRSAMQPATDPRMPTGASPAIVEVTRLIRGVAGHDSSVLILGESGTGKEVVARAVHDSSPRRNRPFVAINCGAIPADLLESELFGHEKGSFTGAVATRKGRFEIAEGGTLFLDEIGDMSLPMQVKLLRVLQERVYERVGSHVQMRCDVRIIAATHRDLEQSIERGTFRQDLYYRLNVFPIEMPALRERAADLPALIHELVERNVADGRAAPQFPPETIEALAGHAWPGNVRELANLVERLSILCGARPVTIADLPPRYRPAGAVVVRPSFAAAGTPAPTRFAPAPVQDAVPSALPGLTVAEIERGQLTDAEALALLESDRPAELAELPEEGIDLRSHLDAIEQRLIRQALERSRGTVAHAARLLGLRRTTLVEKLRKLDDAAADRAGTLTAGAACGATL